MEYEAFFPFCKTGSDAKTMRCTLFRSEWEFKDEEWVYHIAANRFLRGMVRRVMGALLMLGKGKISMQEFQSVMDNKKRQFDSMNVSVPPQGLYLSEVRYPYLTNSNGNSRRELF